MNNGTKFWNSNLFHQKKIFKVNFIRCRKKLQGLNLLERFVLTKIRIYVGPNAHYLMKVSSQPISNHLMNNIQKLECRLRVILLNIGFLLLITYLIQNLGDLLEMIRI